MWKRAALGSSRRGTYLVRLGNSSAATQVVGAIQVQEDIVVSQGKGSLAMDAQAQGKVDWLTRQPAPVPELPADCVVLSLAAGEVQARPVPAVPVVDCSALSDEELACLCVGFGPGLPFPDLQETELPSTLAGEDGQPLTENDHPTGHNGYVSPAIPGKGIHSVFYKDGPAGIGQTGWPGEMLLACSFDRDVLRAMGDAIGRECEVGKVDVWLAPAINLHRHPLGGRNFEYYSEDPVLAGAMAAAVLQGLQENHNVLGCAKHFAANEQETYRRGSAKVKNDLPAFDAVDSILSQRALRELYLKPFQVAVEEGRPPLPDDFLQQDERHLRRGQQGLVHPHPPGGVGLRRGRGHRLGRHGHCSGRRRRRGRWQRRGHARRASRHPADFEGPGGGPPHPPGDGSRCGASALHGQTPGPPGLNAAQLHK